MPYRNNSIVDAGPGISDVDLVAVETRIGQSLPDDLKNFYREYDGGYPQKSDIALSDGDVLTLHQFLRMTSAAGGQFERSYITARVDPGFIPDDLIPFGIDEGGDYFCIRTPSQEIVHFTTDDADDPPAATTWLAASLTQLIETMS